MYGDICTNGICAPDTCAIHICATDIFAQSVVINSLLTSALSTFLPLTFPPSISKLPTFASPSYLCYQYFFSSFCGICCCTFKLREQMHSSPNISVKRRQTTTAKTLFCTKADPTAHLMPKRLPPTNSWQPIVWLRLRTLPQHTPTIVILQNPHQDNQRMWMGTTGLGNTMKAPPWSKWKWEGKNSTPLLVTLPRFYGRTCEVAVCPLILVSYSLPHPLQLGQRICQEACMICTFSCQPMGANR